MYLRAADAWRAAAAAVRDRADDVVSARTKLGGVWDGTAADAVVDGLRTLVDRLDAANAALSSLDQTLSGFADGIVHAQALLADAEALRARYGVRIEADGSVPVDVRQGQVQASMVGIMDDIAGRIEAALRYATDLDVQTTAALAQLLPAVAETMTAVNPNAIPRAGSDPKTVRRWWDSLTAAQRRWLIEDQPALVGVLDGVPADARDQANRILLEESRRDLQARHDDLTARLHALDDPANWNHASTDPRGEAATDRDRLQAELDQVDGKLKGVTAIDRRLSTETPTGTGATGTRGYLLRFDPTGDGRAIVATGNPDAAANVVTYVPGTGANLAGVGHDIDRADRMAATAMRFTPDAPTVAIMWLGYDAPPTIPDATDIGCANHAEGNLTSRTGAQSTHGAVRGRGSRCRGTRTGRGGVGGCGRPERR